MYYTSVDLCQYTGLLIGSLIYLGHICGSRSSVVVANCTWS